jgi:hypothetical protein
LVGCVWLLEIYLRRHQASPQKQDYVVARLAHGDKGKKGKGKKGKKHRVLRVLRDVLDARLKDNGEGKGNKQ